MKSTYFIHYRRYEDGLKIFVCLSIMTYSFAMGMNLQGELAGGTCWLKLQGDVAGESP